MTQPIRDELVIPVIVKLCSTGNRQVCPELVRLAIAHFGLHQRWRVIEALLQGSFPLRVLTPGGVQRESLDYQTPIRERCLPNNDVLLHYFPKDMRLLVAVSGVCRSWRERSASLAPLHGVEC